MQNSEDRTVQDLYKELGLQPPVSIAHMTEDELRKALKIQAHHNWSQQGTVLRCSCELGTHTTSIPTSYILQGTDQDGAPILHKIVL